MLLSIIIPAYNAADYISACLSGLICDSVYSYEIIVINDGSQDTTAQLVAEFAARYPYIRCINQENQGVSAARNAGLAVALGEYVTFVDADDALLILPTLLELLSNCSHDLLIGDFYEITPDGAITCERTLSQTIADKRELLDKELLGGYLLNTCWGKIYRKQIIQEHKLCFPPNVKMGEDLIFILRYISHIKNFHCVPLHIYNYLQLDSGAVRRLRGSITPELVHDKVLCIREKHHYIQQITPSADAITAFYQYQLADTISSINLMFKECPSPLSQYSSLRLLVTTPEIHAILKACIHNRNITLKRRLVAFLYLHRLTCMAYIAIKLLLR